MHLTKFLERDLCLLVILSSLLVFAQEEMTPQDYTTPDGTRLQFGAMTEFSRGVLDDVLDLQADLFIPGNLLAAGFSSLRTVNTTSADLVIGQALFSGYANGAGTAARVSYPASCQVTTDIVLVAEYFNHCVRILNRTNDNTVSDFVGTCLAPGFADGVGTAASFTNPVRIIQDIDDSNLVFVAEASGNIRLINVNSRTPAFRKI
ncbi:uncharacterized protein [Watersipora subatra]|uniref:uncharacterized protein n=1 Tax=Watersipora subatra TaxID=2589382 RepID=UPI00355BA0F1